MLNKRKTETKKQNIPSGREQGFLARKSTLYTYVRAIRTKQEEKSKTMD